MSNTGMGTQIIRRTFGKIKDIVSVPNLIEVQSKSFNDFVQLDCLPGERKNIGLEKVLRDVFPIDYEDKISLEYVSYELGHWACTCGQLTGIENRYSWTCSSCKSTGCSYLNDGNTCPSCHKRAARYDTCGNCLSRVVIQMPMPLDECRSSGQTFSMPLKIKIQLINWGHDEQGVKAVRDIKEQDIFFADLPVMSDLYESEGRFYLGSLGTFLINGVDRVVVSQLHRSPGIVFSQSKKVKDYRGKPYFLARIIPMRGSWIDFEFDSNDVLYVRLDKKKKILLTTFLQALGYAREEIISHFYQSETIQCNKGNFCISLNDAVLGRRIEKGMLDDAFDKKYAGQRITVELLAQLQKAEISEITVRPQSILGGVAARNIINPDTGEVVVEQGEAISEDHLGTIAGFKNATIQLIKSSGYVFRPTIAATLVQDKCYSEEDALKDVHAKVWPGDSASLKEIRDRFYDLIFNGRLYDLTRVGRIRINRKLGLQVPEEITVLTKEDIIGTVRYLVNLRELGEGELDDIDHLGNRRVRLVGELLNNQMYVGFTRIERIVRERCRMQEVHSALMPQDFLNVKPLGAVIREFFGLGQLSQFMDQTNPLAEIAHKRRLSALGPGGVMKDRATFEIRDVHTSHYGRICPIETPEGQTVGLISSLATYAVVNDLGFIETAYRPVENGEIKDDVIFLDAFDEAHNYIAQADAIGDGHKFATEKVYARHEGNFVLVNAKKVDYVDLSSKQLVSVSTALIPFLEHDDAVRALMGANMQRQAVPLISTNSPIVATGMEKEIAIASGALVTAKHAGVVEYVSADKIIVRVEQVDTVHTEDWFAQGIDTYYLRKFQRSSYSTWIHQQPVVKRGDKVAVGDVLSNAQSISQGELALGANLLVAFMPWHGYNFEDAIVLNQRLVSHDVLTSVHIDEYVVDARDTKLGPEEITRDIPNVSDSMLASLDEDGIVRIGTRVKPGDILVGKVTLKGDVQYSPEEKLLRAIFGEKSREVRDTSLRVPPGVNGTVIDIKIFSRGGARKDKRYKKEATRHIEKLDRDFNHHVDLLQKMLIEKIGALVHQQEQGAGVPQEFVVHDLFDKQKIEQGSFVEVLKIKTKDRKINDELKRFKSAYENQTRILMGLREERINKFKKGDVLQSGVIKIVKVYIAMKRPVSVGDKVAGRHGNKGVVSNIVRREDMPYMEDGTPVDIVLNPLGVPSRMNVGQILETVLGMVGYKAGEHVKEMLGEQSALAIEDYLRKFYGSAFVESYKKTYGADGILELARTVARDGLKFKTPVFDSADFEQDIQPLMRDVDFSDTGSVRLRDGRTDEYFDQPVTVGSIYMMKLNHMVDDKLHARSVGPYSLVTQQPLGGKAQQGGQRLGEMEVWALEAYGAAYVLQEMLTVKSDDVTGRHKAYKAIVCGDDVPEPGVPESFNVLIKELQSLGLQVDLLKIGKENVGE